MGIRAICFDGAGTLFTVRESVGVTYARGGRRHGFDIEPRQLDTAFAAVLASAPPLAFPGVPASALARYEREWWHRVAARTFQETGVFDVPRALLEELFTSYASPAAWRCYDETLSTLTALRAQGYRLGVISNFDSRLPAITGSLGISALCDAIIFSTGAGAAKPDRAIFHLALTALDVPRTGALHVGDSQTADVDGARGAGLSAVLLDRSRAHADRDATPARVISTLDELDGFLAEAEP